VAKRAAKSRAFGGKCQAEVPFAHTEANIL
jgi:hypothetical protein